MNLLYRSGVCKTKNPLGFVRYEVTLAYFSSIVQIGDIPCQTVNFRLHNAFLSAQLTCVFKHARSGMLPIINLKI